MSGIEHQASVPGVAAVGRARRWLPRGWRGWLGIFGVVVIVCLVVAWGLSRATPAWYQPLDANETAVLDLAGQTEARKGTELNNMIQRVPLGAQRWTITQDEVNSVLALHFPARAGAVVSQPMVVFSPGKVTLSTRTTRIPSGNALGGVGSVVFMVGIVTGEDGLPRGLVKLNSVWAGYLPVPRSVVEGRLRGVLPGIADEVAKAIELQVNSRSASKVAPLVDEIVRDVVEGKPFPLEYVIDRKRLVILELTVEEGKFSVMVGPPMVPVAGAGGADGAGVTGAVGGGMAP